MFCTLGLMSSLVGGVFGANSGGGGGSEESIWGTFLLATLSSGISIAMGLQLLDLIQLPLLGIKDMNLDDNLTLTPVRVVNGSAAGMTAPGVCTDTVCAYNDSSDVEFDEEGNLLPPKSQPLQSSSSTSLFVPSRLQSTSPSPLTTTTTTTTMTTTQESSSSSLFTDQNVNSLLRTFLLGGSSALVASPCATPVLTSILGFVATSQDPILGAVLLFVYTVGYSTPLLVVAASGGQALVNLQNAAVADGTGAGSAAGAGESLSWVGRLGQVVNPLTASVLIWYGVNGFLEALLGDPSIAGLAPILD